jgi:hypothetical protein
VVLHLFQRHALLGDFWKRLPELARPDVSASELFALFPAGEITLHLCSFWFRVTHGDLVRTT